MLLLNDNVLVNNASVYKFKYILHTRPQVRGISTLLSSKSQAFQCPDGLTTSKRSWLRLCGNADSRDCEYWPHNMRYLGRDSER